MDLAYLKKIIKIVENSAVDEIEIEEEGFKIRVAKNQHQNTVPVQTPMHQVSAVVPVQSTPKIETPPAEAIAPPQEKVEVKYHEVKSPIVGTFYRAPAPDADPYVEVGSIVQPKQVLCIIEAMKLMNEIESDVSGRIVKILVENAQPVEYNQTLFLIEPM